MTYDVFADIGVSEVKPCRRNGGSVPSFPCISTHCLRSLRFIQEAKPAKIPRSFAAEKLKRNNRRLLLAESSQNVEETFDTLFQRSSKYFGNVASFNIISFGFNKFYLRFPSQDFSIATNARREDRNCLDQDLDSAAMVNGATSASSVTR